MNLALLTLTSLFSAEPAPVFVWDAPQPSVPKHMRFEPVSYQAPLPNFKLEPTIVPADTPWLPNAEQVRIRKLIPQGVPVGRNLKFYKLGQVYQEMFTMGNGSQRIRNIQPAHDEEPWRVSGGMHAVPRDAWRNVTGLDLPGPIWWWEEDRDVGAFAPVPRVCWSFPDGTLAYDVLIRMKDGQDAHVFEVRVREKREGVWDSGTTYRPKVSTAGSPVHTYRWAFPSAGFSAVARTHEVKAISPKAEFVATTKMANDASGEFVPSQYAGAGLSCTSCHREAGSRTGYARVRRGEDFVFSWHPWSKDGKMIDPRWPLRKWQ